ncbi:MAG: DUF2809 domain-containing protein [Candidatus Marinimicrobia bacterium]|nr:DUF2809 domain-containing protein [Candidatus Neomarinimicrobiota bacterium]
MGKNWEPDKRVIFTILLLIPIGISTKFYDGYAKSWVNNSLSDILYVVFWTLILFSLRPSSNPYKICGLVFIISSIIEISQLWNFPIIIELRKGFIGKSLFGNTFIASDFLYYFLGSCSSYFLIKYFQNSANIDNA